MAQLLNSILNVIKVFQKYAQENGDCTLLCKQELKQLLLAEFGSILRVRRQAPGPSQGQVSLTPAPGLNGVHLIWSSSSL